MTREEEKLEVRNLGEKIGYGNMMYLASSLWKQSLREQGYPESGAFIPALQSDIKSNGPHRRRGEFWVTTVLRNFKNGKK